MRFTKASLRLSDPISLPQTHEVYQSQRCVLHLTLVRLQETYLPRMPSTINMFLTPLITSAALALFNGLYLHHLGASQSLRDSGLPADILATADFTNDLIHYVQALHSPQLQDFVAPADTYGLDEDYAIVTIGHIDENYHDAMSLETPVDFSDCEPLFDKLWYYRPDDQPPNDEDETKLKAVIEEFVHGTASETVERCIKSMGIAVQQHVYLRKLHAATSLWVQNIEKTDLPDQHVDIRDQRSYKLTAGVTYLSVMLEAWTH